jgi:eukaryotic-like serine/threonine-protein kinase
MRSARVVAATALLALLVAGCSEGSSSANSPTGAASGFLTYSDSKYGFRISYPPDWAEQLGVAGTVVAFLSSSEDSSDTFRENVNVGVEDLPNPGMTLDQFTAAALAQVEGLITNFTLVSKEATAVAGRFAERVVYTGQQGKFDLKWQQVWLIDKARAYVLTYTAEVPKFDEFLSVANAIIGTFEPA